MRGRKADYAPRGQRVKHGPYMAEAAPDVRRRLSSSRVTRLFVLRLRLPIAARPALAATRVEPLAHLPGAFDPLRLQRLRLRLLLGREQGPHLAVDLGAEHGAIGVDDRQIRGLLAHGGFIERAGRDRFVQRLVRGAELVALGVDCLLYTSRCV